jgi:cobalt-zinc-cadmium resistance protein CzcA
MHQPGGRPDDGTDTPASFNTEYFVDLKPKEQVAARLSRNKGELIAAMNRELEKIPGVVWGFSQPIADNMEEAVSGVKGELATKIYGDDLKVLEEKRRDRRHHARGQGHRGSGSFPRPRPAEPERDRGPRGKAARYQINVADVQDAIQTAVGGNALTQVLQGRAALRPGAALSPQYRDTRKPSRTSVCSRLPASASRWRSSAKSRPPMALRKIYREGNQRYVAIKYSVRGRDLGSTVEEAIKKVNEQVKLPTGYSIDWAGEYESQKRAHARLADHRPDHHPSSSSSSSTPCSASLQVGRLNLMNCSSRRLAGCSRCWFTGTNFSVSSGVGFLALFGVSVQTGVIMVEYINQLRARGFPSRTPPSKARCAGCGRS